MNLQSAKLVRSWLAIALTLLAAFLSNNKNADRKEKERETGRLLKTRNHPV